jgi:hypothetical protein
LARRPRPSHSHVGSQDVVVVVVVVVADFGLFAASPLTRCAELGAVLELAADPFAVSVSFAGVYEIRAASEAAGQVSRSLVSVGAAIFFKGNASAQLVGVAFSHVVYSVALLASYAVQFAMFGGRHRGSALPSLRELRPQPSKGLPKDKTLLRQYVLQSVQKLLLQEGERLLLVLFATPAQMACFAVVSSLGGIAARVVFQPVEQAAFAAFAHMDPTEAVAGLGPLAVATGGVGLAAAALGPAVSHLAGMALQVTDGDVHPLFARLSQPGAPLAAYSAYVFALALNGVSEALVHATADRKELARNTRFLFALTIMSLAVGAGALRFAGVTGLVLAGIIGMSLRVSYNVSYVRRVFHVSGAKAVMPPRAVISGAVAAAAVGRWSLLWVYNAAEVEAVFRAGDSAGGRRVAIAVGMALKHSHTRAHVLIVASCALAMALLVVRCAKLAAAEEPADDGKGFETEDESDGDADDKVDMVEEEAT